MKNNNKLEISVGEYYQNRSIFITGATGFVGKVLVEKLLRVCHGIEYIFVLIRPRPSRSADKPGQSAQERLVKLFDSAIFQKLKNESPEIFHKVIAISGDISWDNMGISKEDAVLLSKKVSVIFHLAATVKFNESLATVLNINLGGTQRVLELSKTMPRLSAIVHCSTAYSNADLYDIQIDEVVYPSPCDPRSLLDNAAWFDQIGVLDAVTPNLIGNKPNTYVFSKYMAENLVQREAVERGIPVCIVRPSIVSPIYKDPAELKGWVDNLMGFSGFLYAIGHGLNYISLGDPNTRLDLIPVDYVVDLLILAAWDLGTERMTMEIPNQNQIQDDGHGQGHGQVLGPVHDDPDDGGILVPDENQVEACRVYNACVDQFNPITNAEVGEYGTAGNLITPFNRMLRPFSLKLTTSLFLYTFLNFFAVGIPCLFLDLGLYLRGQRPKLYRIYSNVNNAFSALAYFRTRNFRFSSDNVASLQSKIVPEDAHNFDLNLADIKWPEYVHNCLIGLRRYYDKDDDTTLPDARKQVKRLKGIYWAVLVISILLVLLLLVGSGFAIAKYVRL